jgi:hypothetical protein
MGGSVKIAGCWDTQMIPSPAMEFNSRWKYLVNGFCLDGIYMAPVTGFTEGYRTSEDRRDHVIEVQDIMEAVEANPDLVPVLVDECSSDRLQSFTHPRDALYLFGRTGQSFFDYWGGRSVSIEPAGAMSAYLQPDQAAAIVLYDRMIKSWR